jgi:regulator of sigma E protease
VDNLVLELFAAVDAGAILSRITNVLSVVLGLGLVIFFHELGHFAVAKWCNVHVERFSIGIGPILWSYQKGETEYALSALPFGGYVKMLGQDDMDPNQMTSSEIAENPRSYSAKSVPQRMAIISAGVIMNIATGFLFFVICYRFGVFETAPVAGGVFPGNPAWEQGLRAGDRLTRINGERILSFSDVMEAIVLSSGSVKIDGVHADGEPFSHTISPLRTSPGRSIGVMPSDTTQIMSKVLSVDAISDAGLPLEKASEDFLPGDRIVSITPGARTGSSVAEDDDSELTAVETKQLYQLRHAEAKYADRMLTYTVERTDQKSDDSRASAGSRQVQIVVPPAEVRSIGLWMAMGPIRAIQIGSIAEKAGLKVGDVIQSVDDLIPGTNYDPLRLPVYFAERAGSPVKVVVDRATTDGNERLEIEVTPTDAPGWFEDILRKTNPLAISSIGVGYQVQPRIVKVLPGSEAEKSGVLAPAMKITHVELIHPAPGSGKPDAFGEKETPEKLDLAVVEKKQPGTADEINWAWAFSMIQMAPERQLRLYYDDGKKQGSVVLSQQEPTPDWYHWSRGFNFSIWRGEEDLQKGETIGQATQLGLRKTRKTMRAIYLSLRALVRGDVAADSMSGPLGIASIGYQVAERGIIPLLMFLAYLSINLAILNFLPIPILDGGHMVFLLWEGITRRKPSPRVIGVAYTIGLMFIISLFAFVMFIDISALWG